MKTKAKPFVANFFIPIANEVSNHQEYNEKKQVCFRNIEDLRNSTNTSSAPTNDADSDTAESMAEL